MSDPIERNEFREQCIKRGFKERMLDGGVNFVIRRWEAEVRRIGKKVCIDHDYLYAMGVRQIIYELIPLMSDADWAAIEERLKLADQRLRDLTVSVDRCLDRRGTSGNEVLTPEVHWWYFTRPKYFGEN
jgi:hypothetical protein